MKQNQRREMVQGEKSRGENQEQVPKSPPPVESHRMRLNRSAMMYDNTCNVLSTWEAQESVFLLGVSHVGTPCSNDWPQLTEAPDSRKESRCSTTNDLICTNYLDTLVVWFKIPRMQNTLSRTFQKELDSQVLAKGQSGQDFLGNVQGSS